MGKVEYAYSLKLHKDVTASEAHEAWVMGKINDKTKFQCCSPACSAQITCVNMDKPQWQMKMREHFKVFGEHNVNCTEVMKQKNINVKEVQGMSKKAPEIGETIAFHMGRPVNHDEISSNTNDNSSQTKKTKSAAGKVGHDKEKHQRASNLYLLSTLMRKYLSAKKNNKLNEIKISLELSGKIYGYSLNTLFNEIAQASIIKDEAWKTKVYFGKVIIRKNDKNEYWINFIDKFKDSDSAVRCSIKKEIINSTHNKSGSIRSIERFLNKEAYCFLLGTVQITNTSIYINIKSLDHIAYSFDDVKTMSDLIADE